MDLNLFKIPGIEVREEYEDRTAYPYITFKSLSEHYLTTLSYDPNEMDDESYWRSVAEKINTLVYNRVKFEDRRYISEKDLLDFIDRNIPKYTPSEKLFFVLEYFFDQTEYDGKSIDFSCKEELKKNQIWRRYYFKNENEFLFYFECLVENRFLRYNAETNDSYIGIQLTLTGLNKMIALSEIRNSNTCFVAMSFDPSLEDVYNDGIFPAITESGFQPIIIRNEDVASDKTINDAILAGIKKAKFTIADFTQHKAGVYFEAGYALGRGQKVIYTCKEDDLQNAHFDTRNYQHIVWNSTKELKEKLLAKISVFIKD